LASDRGEYRDHRNHHRNQFSYLEADHGGRSIRLGLRRSVLNTARVDYNDETESRSAIVVLGRGIMKLIGVILLVVFATTAVLFVITFIQTASELEHFRADCRQLSENRFRGETAWHCNDDITYFKDPNGQIISRVGNRNSRPKY
jgi:phage tail tape-measure protein